MGVSMSSPCIQSDTCITASCEASDEDQLVIGAYPAGRLGCVCVISRLQLQRLTTCRIAESFSGRASSR